MAYLTIGLAILAVIISGVSIYLTYQMQRTIQSKQIKQDRELAKMLAKQDSFIFMTQKQYEKEYHLFWNLFDLLQQTIDRTRSIKGSLQLLKENSEPTLEETYVKLIQDGVVRSSESLNELDNQLNQYEPFIQEMLFNEFKQIIEDLRDFQQRRFNYFSYESVTNETIEDFLNDTLSSINESEAIRKNIVIFLRKYFENSRVN
ncbi:hypothetical protein [Vagococcus luciliae]|uniref:Uncharacterized protein n=1 Tax=Vagococcus luciliae TaxID=2920380 RepID=A0ABY5NY91_9ENTE|nr:hypothetical protein [Vagococcus luciliae]UUV98406.1 hypothetical protein G314FT_05220 [Vagococcus luciliae]